MHSILQSISSGSHSVFTFDTVYLKILFRCVCATLGIHFNFIPYINIFSHTFVIWHLVKHFLIDTYTALLFMLTPTSTRTHIIYPIFFVVVSFSKKFFCFPVFFDDTHIQHTIENALTFYSFTFTNHKNHISAFGGI